MTKKAIRKKSEAYIRRRAEAIKNKGWIHQGILRDRPSERKNIADQILRNFDNLCESLGIKWFIGWGTCLGFYRDGEYIPWDNDIDVAVMCDDEKWAELVDGLWELGCRAKGQKSLHQIHYWCGLLLLDIHRIPQRKPYTEFYTNLGTINYNGRDYPVPAPIEEYLEWKYGKDWRIPR